MSDLMQKVSQDPSFCLFLKKFDYTYTDIVIMHTFCVFNKTNSGFYLN